MKSSVDSIPLACVPAAIPTRKRSSHFALARKLFAELAKERTELPDGYAFRFEADEFETVTRFIANERRCCPFMTFEVEVAPASGPVWLRMTGPQGTRDVLDAELNLSSSNRGSGSCACCEAQ